MTLRFGTDGGRGAANTELTPELALALGRAAARTLGPGPWVVGRDTRVSGPLLHAAFASGLASEGATSVDLGVVPTPAVAFLAAADQLPGAMISASHNSFGDNGIKLFRTGGLKLDDATEDRLEADLESIEAEGIEVDEELEVLGRAPFGGGFHVRLVRAGTEHDLGDLALGSIWITAGP